MSTKQRIAVALGVFALLGVLAFLGWSYETKRAAPGPAAGAVTVDVTSPGDSGYGTLREALFIAAAAKGQATVVIRTKTITLQAGLQRDRFGADHDGGLPFGGGGDETLPARCR